MTVKKKQRRASNGNQLQTCKSNDQKGRFSCPKYGTVTFPARWSKPFSDVDFSQFYHQLPLHPDDIPKTAFYACGQLYEFLRRPFGLTNAVTYRCRTTQKLFGNIEGVTVYFDDLLVYAKTQSEYDERLRKVFESIQDQGLSLNLSKCTFNRREILYLGHLIKDGVLRPGPARSEAACAAKLF